METPISIQHLKVNIFCLLIIVKKLQQYILYQTTLHYTTLHYTIQELSYIRVCNLNSNSYHQYWKGHCFGVLLAFIISLFEIPKISKKYYWVIISVFKLWDITSATNKLHKQFCKKKPTYWDAWLVFFLKNLFMSIELLNEEVILSVPEASEVSTHQKWIH